MLTYILLGLGVIVVIFLIVVAMQPGDFRVTRSAKIAAPATVVFPHVNDLHKWQAWSPWAKMDPAAKNTFEGPAEGLGSIFSWDGNNKVGSGRMTVIESRPSALVKFKLEFFKPFKAVNTAEFTFTPEGNQTLVTWSMYGPNNFVGKAMHLLIDCDKMVGSQFEKGLADLKALAETGSKA
jgi:hypothetical protein